MIRKAFFCIIILVVIGWLAVAYYLKSKVLKSLAALEGSNIHFSYNDCFISGFPFIWKVNIKEPKISLTSQSSVRELSTQKVQFYFNYNLSSAHIISSSVFNYNFAKADTHYNYVLSSEEEIPASIDFISPVYMIPGNKLWNKNYIKSFSMQLPYIQTVANNNEIFHISNSKVKLVKDEESDIDTYKLKIMGDYEADISDARINKAYLSLDCSYFIQNSQKPGDKQHDNFDHRLEVNKFLFKFDNSSVDIRGLLDLYRTSMPVGKMAISMVRYQDVIDFFIPEDFIISRSYIKKVIAKSTMATLNKVASNEDFVKVDVNFSDKGLLIGNLNLFELNLDK